MHQINIPMNKQTLPKPIAQFLEKHHFFNFQEYDSYAPLLDAQIADRLEFSNPLNLAIPLKEDKTRQEKKAFLVLDLGGTYLRLYLCQNSGKETTILAEHKLPFYHDKIYTPEVLIEDLTMAIKGFSVVNKDQFQSLKWDQIVFSFGNALQPKLKTDQLDGKILYWGKRHEQKGILGLWLGSELQENLRKNGLPDCTVQLINDGTLSTLAAYTESGPGDCLASLIVGTGTNINVGFSQGKNYYLANLEFGDFEFAPYSNFDEQLNVKVSTPNHFRTEKMFSGAWQNLLFETILEFAVKEKLLSTKEIIEHLKNHSSAELETIFNSGEAPQFKMNKDDWEISRTLWNELTARGAALCAFAISRLALQLKKPGYLQNHLLLVPSGALLEHTPIFQDNFQKSLQTIMTGSKELANLEIVFVKSHNTTCQASAALLQLLQIK